MRVTVDVALSTCDAVVELICEFVGVSVGITFAIVHDECDRDGCDVSL